MSKVIEVLKKVWKSDRYRSLSILCLYFIFFLIIILITKMTPSKKITPKEKGMPDIEISNTYSFEISVKDDVIEGSYDYSYIKFIYNDVTYEYSNEILLPNTFLYMDILPFMNKNYVYELVRGKEVYSTTKFNDESLAKTYLVNNIEITTYSDDLNKIDVKINDMTYKILYK